MLLQSVSINIYSIDVHVNIRWFYLAIFTALYGSHSQSKNDLYFPNFMYFSTYFSNFYDIFYMWRKR